MPTKASARPSTSLQTLRATSTRASTVPSQTAVRSRAPSSQTAMRSKLRGTAVLSRTMGPSSRPSP
eukprot:7691835-Pyramimonas_sp.AAC.1